MKPFFNVGAVVTGDDFIGRKDLLETLEELVLSKASVNVVGLPRMGKTSLVKQCFTYGDRPRWWMEQHRMIPVYHSLDTQPDALGMWGALADALRRALRKAKKWGLAEDGDEMDKLIDSLAEMNRIALEGDRFTLLSSVICDLYQEQNLRPVLLLDELDSLMRYSYSVVTLSRLRSLGGDSSVVTCSRRHPDIIEEKVGGKHYFSKASTTLYVGLFSEEDVAAFWSHFESAFSFLDSPMFLQYRQLVDRYVGRHPMLMSSMNYDLFQDDAALLKQWGTTHSVADRQQIERKIRADVHVTFLEQMRYVKEQELQDTAVRLVVGGMGTPDSDLRDSLLRYQFIREIPSEEKRELFGYDLGYREGDVRFVCFSDFSSHQMVEMFDPPMEGFDLLKQTELLLRQLIRSYLSGLEEDDPFGHVEDGDGFVHERWEEPFLRKARSSILGLPIPPEDKTDCLDRLQQDFNKILSVWDKRYNNDFKPSLESEIDIVSSSSLGSLWHVFIRWSWREFFAEVLAGSVKYRTQSALWYKEVFKPILLWRNAVNHFRDEEWKEESVQLSQERCRQVCKAIESWLKHRM